MTAAGNLDFSIHASHAKQALIINGGCAGSMKLRADRCLTGEALALIPARNVWNE
jgi:hypothetical protein